ncbi:MAG: serine/threonine protein kinase [Cyanobacteria bacterium NC_groundwater_1444_Ag_S-0.65um_54_12]|nr:serine/threonine protein kinase [Cyanobacteria bacterium NC_groundwater_1444_Ag_S-0.65um_54_12]
MIALAVVVAALLAVATPTVMPAYHAVLSEASSLSARGDIAGAVSLLRTAADRSTPTQRALLHLRAARLLAHHARWEEALAEGHAGIAAQPQDGLAYLQVAKILYAAGRQAAAIELAQLAMKRDPKASFAAQDLIFEIQTHQLSEFPAANLPSSPHPMGLIPIAGALAVFPVLAGIGVIVWRRRRQSSRERRVLATIPTAHPAYEHADSTYDRPLIPGDTIDSYQIEQVVSTSLHSTLYRARDLRLQRQVAIKRVNLLGQQSETVLARFRKEVQSLVALSTHHDGVIKVYDYVPPATLITEWVEGQNLEELAAELAVDQILQVGIELCDILEFAHVNSIIHRDIKPSNVMVMKQTQRVKLLDFGIAKNAALGMTQATSDSDVPIGTFTYMAPEQFASPAQAQPVSDVYSLGLSLYRLITGELPTTPWLGPRTFGLMPLDAFKPIDEFATGVQAFLGRLDGLLPDLDWIGELNRVIRKAFAEQPSWRYSSAKEFKAALEQVRSLVSASIQT